MLCWRLVTTNIMFLCFKWTLLSCVCHICVTLSSFYSRFTYFTFPGNNESKHGGICMPLPFRERLHEH